MWLLVIITAKPDRRDACLRHLEALFDHHRRDAAFVSACVHPRLDDDDGIVVYEQWSETREAFLEGIERRAQFAAFERDAGDLIAGREMVWLGEPRRIGRAVTDAV